VEPLILIAVLVLAGVQTSSFAAESENKKPLRVEDLPKPIPEAMDALKRGGNAVGEAISKGSAEAARGVKKALDSDKSEKEKK
jgi:hypothetical protein